MEYCCNRHNTLDMGNYSLNTKIVMSNQNLKEDKIWISCDGLTSCILREVFVTFTDIDNIREVYDEDQIRIHKLETGYISIEVIEL